MIRKAFRMSVNPDQHAEYERRHSPIWPELEAVLKAHGRGLAFGMDRLAFAEHAGALVLVAADPALGPAAAWRLHEFVPRPGYRAAIAWKPVDAP